MLGSYIELKLVSLEELVGDIGKQRCCFMKCSYVHTYIRTSVAYGASNHMMVIPCNV